MGEVYRGLDTRLGRHVAVKCTLEAFTERFQVEARAISSINHPHICTLYDVGPNYLVMELIEGEQLSSVIGGRALPLDRALRYGAQIADALAAAHAKGLVHRDLKPGNVMVTKSGVKVLDFGLAKFLEPADETQMRTRGLVGTPAYMAPEQLAGQSADARTDIFALGMVLHEMATGRRVLTGQGQTPALDALPGPVAHVIGRCLATDPDDRWQAASDVRRELEWVARTGLHDHPAHPNAGRRTPVALAAVAVVSLAVGAAVDRWATRVPPSMSAPATRSTIALPAGLRLDSEAPLALSPDGATLAFTAINEAGERHLFARPLALAEPKALPGTRGARHPFFSPDGRSVGFFADGRLQRVDVNGDAPPLRLATLPGADHGGAWGTDVIVVAVRGQGLFKINAAGGTLQPLASNIRSMWPSFMPDGTTIIYNTVHDGPTVAISTIALDGTKARDVATMTRTTRASGAPVLGTEWVQNPRLVDDVLLYGQDPGIVRALPVDSRSLAIRGTTITLASSVERGNNSGGVAFAVSRNGLLVFAETGTAHQLVWVTRQGVVTPLDLEKAAYREPRLSPDDKTIVVSANDETRTQRLWTIDVSRRVKTLFGYGIATAWHPKGGLIAAPGPQGSIQLLPPHGEMPPEVLLTRDQLLSHLPSGTSAYVTGWSPDGRYVLMEADSQDVWRVSLPDKTLEAVFTGATDEWDATISPDGRVIAYCSSRSGIAEVYVATWPGLDRRTVVSTKGGIHPRWSRDGRELFFRQGDTLMAARVGSALEVQTPIALFSGPFFGAGRSPSFDVAADGRFLMVKADERAELKHITVVHNWMAAFDGSVP
jgi:Tol biopolymer transport system component